MLIKKIWENKEKILEGLWNRVFRKAYVEKIFNKRIEICKTCPHLDALGDDCYIPGTAPCCGKCGCELATKLRSMSSGCGDEVNPRWDAEETDEDDV